MQSSSAVDSTVRHVGVTVTVNHVGLSAHQVGWAHTAFSVSSPAAVDSLTDWLRGDGFRVLSGPRTTRDGYYEAVVLDLEGNQVEVTA